MPGNDFEQYQFNQHQRVLASLWMLPSGTTRVKLAILADYLEEVNHPLAGIIRHAAGVPGRKNRERLVTEALFQLYRERGIPCDWKGR